MRKILLTISLLLLPVIAHSAVEISDVYELQDMLTDLTTDYVLINDIDASTTTTWNYNAERGVYEGWYPVGGHDEDDFFTGSFDGQGYSINDLYINRTLADVGLFGYTNKAGKTIKDFSIIDADITGGARAGIIAGMLRHQYVYNIYVSGDVSGSSQIGCFAGFISSAEGNRAYIDRVAAIGNVSGGNDIGGFLGRTHNNIKITDSYFIGTVTGDTNVGGFGGYNRDIPAAEIRQSFSTAEVTGNTNVGGFWGFIRFDYYIDFYDCFWNTDNTTQTEDTGDRGDRPGVTASTTTVMTDWENDYPDCYTNFDFTATGEWQVTSWNTDQEGNAGYPALAWQTDPTPTPTPVIEKWIPYIIRY